MDGSVPLTDDDAALTALAGALRAAAVDAPAETHREALDVLAVAAGLKPVAVIGYGGASPALEGTILDRARGFGFAVRHCTAWTSRGEFRDVPPWFAQVAVDARSSTALLAVSLLPDRLHPLHDDRAATLAPFTETALLGYPTCCTGYHAAWHAAVHRHVAGAILAAAGNDERRARRMAAVGWTPTPKPGGALAALLDRPVAPYTAIVMCPDCAAAPSSPARRISAVYAGLAARLGFEDLPTPDEAKRNPGPTTASAQSRIMHRAATATAP